MLEGLLREAQTKLLDADGVVASQQELVETLRNQNAVLLAQGRESAELEQPLQQQ